MSPLEKLLADARVDHAGPVCIGFLATGAKAMAYQLPAAPAIKRTPAHGSGELIPPHLLHTNAELLALLACGTDVDVDEVLLEIIYRRAAGTWPSTAVVAARAPGAAA